MVDSNTIPIPASRLEELALSAAETVSDEAAKGRYNNAQDTASAIAEALDAAGRKKGGRFTSIDADKLSHLTAFGGDNRIARDCAEVFLVQYDVWSGE